MGVVALRLGALPHCDDQTKELVDKAEVSGIRGLIVADFLHHVVGRQIDQDAVRLSPEGSVDFECHDEVVLAAADQFLAKTAAT
jgi:hypothetical protein